MEPRRRSGSLTWWLVTLLLLCVQGAVAVENVDPADDGSQYAWGEHIGWLNAEPQGDGAVGVTVGDTELTGWIWAGDHGWISLSCQNTSSCGTNDYGVTNDGRGNLSGFAWGEHLGWINFRTGDGSDCCSENLTPGCTDPICESTLCSFDPYCCNTEWDEVCAISAELEPACVMGCASDAWGVRIHGFTGEFSGFAWTEDTGWINFGSALEPQPYRIETGWRCPDPDVDGVCSASDNCPGWSNTRQDSVLFGQSALAANKTDLVWADPVDWQLASGTFTTTSDVGNYNVDFFDSGTGTSYTDTSANPPAGIGYWYLFRPGCPIGSYSSGGASEQGDRDGALIP